MKLDTVRSRPAVLQWLPVTKRGSPRGELLAAFELFLVRLTFYSFDGLSLHACRPFLPHGVVRKRSICCLTVCHILEGYQILPINEVERRMINRKSSFSRLLLVQSYISTALFQHCGPFLLRIVILQ